MESLLMIVCAVGELLHLRQSGKRGLQGGILRLSAVLLLAVMTSAGWSLQVGDTAPELHVSQWVKGTSTTMAEARGKEIVVIEFWATWCPPCRKSIPHLTELQKKFKDKGVKIIGISSEEPGVIEPFVKGLGMAMDYTVAADDDQQTSIDYMEGVQESAIPHAFIINRDGILVWHGHPQAGLESNLEKLLSGKFDMEMAKREESAGKLLKEYQQSYMGNPAGSGSDKLAEQILDKGKDSPEVLNMLAYYMLHSDNPHDQQSTYALTAAEQSYKLSGGTDPFMTGVYAEALFASGKHTEAIALQKKALEAAIDDAQLQDYLEAKLSQFERLDESTSGTATNL
jgi:peroxiredoxin